MSLTSALSSVNTPTVLAVLAWLVMGKPLTIAAYSYWARRNAGSPRRVFRGAVVTAEQSRWEARSLVLVLTDASLLLVLITTDVLRLGPDTPGRILFTTCAVGLWAEVWFYFVHRWMHATDLGWWIHQHHHRSIAVQPLTAASFSFCEKFFVYTAAWQLFLAVMSRFVPVSIVGIALHYTFYFLTSPLAHSNIEPVPAAVAELPFNLGKILGSATGHALHHVRNDTNLGFQTTLLDRLFGTYATPTSDDRASFKGAQP